jgi:hypothetical protein
MIDRAWIIAGAVLASAVLISAAMVAHDRYELFGRSGGSVFRVDRVTGVVSFCVAYGATGVCRRLKGGSY